MKKLIIILLTLATMLLALAPTFCAATTRQQEDQDGENVITLLHFNEGNGPVAFDDDASNRGRNSDAILNKGMNAFNQPHKGGQVSTDVVIKWWRSVCLSALNLEQVLNNKEKRKMKLTQVLTISLVVIAATILSAGDVAAASIASLSIDSTDSGVVLRPHDMQDTQTYYILSSEDIMNWSYLRGKVTTLGTNIHVETGGDSVVIIDGADSQTSVFIDTAYQQRRFYQTTQFPPLESEMDWVWIDDPGFNGEMSRYETTNTQYCAFLNAALASGDITVSNNVVYGANGANGGGDFVGQIYCYTFNANSYSQIVYSGDSFTVRSRDGLDANSQPTVYDMSNHPVVMVSWHGATAFSDYYGYRLPTEWEWQAVAIMLTHSVFPVIHIRAQLIITHRMGTGLTIWRAMFENGQTAFIQATFA
jgi:Sulfatase-modifying factor enzyme 1